METPVKNRRFILFQPAESREGTAIRRGVTMVSPELLNELKAIIKEDYGTKLQPEKLSEIGNGLVNFFESLLKIQKTKQNVYENSGSRNN